MPGVSVQLGIGVVLSSFALLFGYLRWSRATSRTLRDVEVAAKNRLEEREFGTRYRAKVLQVYVSAPDRNSASRSVLRSLFEEAIPFRDAEGNVTLNLRVGPFDQEDVNREPTDRTEHHSVYVKREHGLNDEGIREIRLQGDPDSLDTMYVYYDTSNVEQVRETLDDFDEVLNVILNDDESRAVDVYPSRLLERHVKRG